MIAQTFSASRGFALQGDLLPDTAPTELGTKPPDPHY